MSIIDLGNGSVLKNGVVFNTEARKYCTEINKDENGKVISKTFKHFILLLYYNIITMKPQWNLSVITEYAQTTLTKPIF